MKLLLRREFAKFGLEKRFYGLSIFVKRDHGFLLIFVGFLAGDVIKMTEM